MILAANTTWYIARAGGLLAFTLLTASVVLGLLLSRRDHFKSWPRFALEDVHRFVSLLAGAFIVVHVGSLLFDSYLPFSLTNVLVPGTAPYRSLSVAAGVVAAELLAALAVTNRYRHSLPRNFWRRAHYLNFAVWLLAFVHGILAGTDATTPWGITLYLASAGAVGALVAGRLLPAQRPARQHT